MIAVEMNERFGGEHTEFGAHVLPETSHSWASWCMPSGSILLIGSHHDLQTCDLVSDRRRAERYQPGRSRVRGRPRRVAACGDSRGAGAGIRAMGPAAAARSRRRPAPGSARSVRGARRARSRGDQAAAGGERGAGAPGLHRTDAGAETGVTASRPAALAFPPDWPGTKAVSILPSGTIMSRSWSGR